jgi:hypothetical protein
MYNTYMTTVLRRGRLKISIYREKHVQHHLPHCHVYLADAEAIFSLMDFECLANNGFNTRALKQIKETIAEHQEEFLEMWRLLNGKEN